MTLKTVVIAAFMTVVPALSYAQCSRDHHETTVASCMEGSTWDEATQMCVPIVTG